MAVTPAPKLYPVDVQNGPPVTLNGNLVTTVAGSGRRR